MKKWTKRVALILALLFAYLGTGYQLAAFSWDTLNSDAGVRWLTKPSRNNGTGRFVADTLWPISFRAGVVVKEDANGKLKLDGIISPSSTMTKNEYLFWTTISWGPKIIFNLFFSNFATLLAWIGLIGWSLVKFLWVFCVSLLNLILAPFGAKI